MKTLLQSLACSVRTGQFSKFGRLQKGVTMIEYALIAALIAVILVAVLTSLGTELGVTFTKIKTALTTANTP